MAEFDRIVEALYNKIFYNEGNVDEILSEEKLEQFKTLLKYDDNPYPVVRLVEAGQSEDGTQWYRLYSDGWCEQGGICTSHAYNVDEQQVTFLKSYKDTNYTAIVSAGPTTQAQYQIAARIAVKTETGLDIRGGISYNGTYSGDCSWYACGYVSTEN